jgi:DnaJ-class molecular chaperone
MSLYELLEIPPEATPAEIARAYQIARAAYSPSSMATYPIFSEEEKSEILRRVEAAYEVLGDERRRGEYDARMRRDLAPGASQPGRGGAQNGECEGQGRLFSSEEDLELEGSLEPEDGLYDGAVLRRIRLSRGVELAEISAVTKISQAYLRCIEENRLQELPSAVYVRGFLREYAKCLRLDPIKVTKSYMEQCLERGPGGG